MRRWLLALLKKWPKLFFLYYSQKYKQQIRKAKHLIIVTSPGHVGSSTTYRSLLSGNWPTDTAIYDIHSLNESFNNNEDVDSISARHVLQVVLKRMLKAGKLHTKQITLITIFRDPVARALGGIFQNKEVFLHKIDKEHNHNYLQTLDSIKSFMLKTNYLANTINWQVQFLENELRKFWGIDIYQTAEIDLGCFHINADKTNFILFTLENLNEQLPKQIKYILGVDIRLEVANSSEQRKDSEHELYNFCKEHLRFDYDTLLSIFDQQLMQKIYSKQQKETFIKRWS